jgi:DNA-binding NarL/FixJ family response regulator
LPKPLKPVEEAPKRASASTRNARALKNSAPADRGPGGAGVRVLCVDDHAVLVEGLKAQFAIDGRIQVVGRLASAEKLLDEVARLKPDIVMLDIEMPGPDVFEMADRMRSMYPNLRFVFLSAHIRDGYLSAAYKCGAWGYFAKGDELEDIAAGVLELARSTAGTFVMGPKVKQRCGGARSSGSPFPKGGGARPVTPLEELTTREVEVLRLIGKGLSRVEIAKELSRSAKTVDGHQERMMKKLGIESRADLMRFAIREGFAEA